MVTTIQINDGTLKLLKKVKDETSSSSYDETINRLITIPISKESLAGYLGKKPLKWILKDLRDKSGRL